MANTILTNDIILKLTLKNLVNTLGTVKAATRQYEDKFITGVGTSIRIANPVRFVGGSGNNIVSYESIDEQETVLAIDQTEYVAIQLTQVELSRKVTDFNDCYARPIGINLANKCNEYMTTIGALGFDTIVGSTAAISGYNPIDNAKVRLINMGIDWMDMYCGLSPQSMGGVRQGTLGLFTPVANDKILMKGAVGDYDGFTMYQDQSMKFHTTGTMAGTPAVAATVTTNGTTTVSLSGFTASQTGVLLKGDKITFSNSYAVNPITKDAYAYLQTFTVAADVDSDGAGAATVTLVNPLFFTGPYQNVSATPTAADTVECYNVTSHGTAVSYMQNLAYTKTGLAFAAPPRVRNPGAYYSENMTDGDSGISMCLNIDYTTQTNTNRYRFDVVFGGKAFGGGAFGGYGLVLSSAS